MVIERPSTNNGGRLLILGVDIQSWAVMAAFVVSIGGGYFSLSSGLALLAQDVSGLHKDIIELHANLETHRNVKPAWAVQLEAEFKNLVQREEQVESRLDNIDTRGTRGLGILNERLNSLSSLYSQLDSIRATQQIILQAIAPHRSIDDFVRERQQQKSGGK